MMRTLKGAVRGAVRGRGVIIDGAIVNVVCGCGDLFDMKNAAGSDEEGRYVCNSSCFAWMR